MTQDHDTLSLAGDGVAQAEALALKAEEHERIAQERFERMRDALAAQGRGHEATRNPEFHAWMEARNATDEAWRLWAMATDAARG